VTSEPFGTLADRRDVTAYTLTNGGLVVRFLSYGGIIQSLHAPDRDGRMADLTPGYDSLG
jgi:aldose 1-epimerase